MGSQKTPSMKNMIRLTAIFLVMCFALPGCYYDKESELYPYTECGDTTNVTYAKSIAPIMVAHCNVCHSTGIASGSVITDTHDGLYIVAGNGTLWTSVNWTGDPMPKGSLDTLSVCDRTKIKKWIDAGALDN
jgi:hypothetical protein